MKRFLMWAWSEPQTVKKVIAQFWTIMATSAVILAIFMTGYYLLGGK